MCNVNKILSSIKLNLTLKEQSINLGSQMFGERIKVSILTNTLLTNLQRIKPVMHREVPGLTRWLVQARRGAPAADSASETKGGKIPRYVFKLP